MNFVSIISAEDPRIADYVAVRERDLTGRDGKFIVEGKVTLEVFLRRARFQVESLFLETSRIPVLTDLLETLPDDIPVYVADQDVMDKIVGFPIHRGILACGRKASHPSLDDWYRASFTAPQTLVMGIGLSNHDNIGALFRNAAALGASGVLLDETCGDPLYRKSIRVSAGTALWLPFYHGGTAGDLFDLVERNQLRAWTLTPRADAASLYDLPRNEPACLVVGAEGPGLPQELINRGSPVCIPMSHAVDSLNVATSLAIALSWRFSPPDTQRKQVCLF